MVMRRELMAGDRDDAVWEFDDVLLVIPKKHHQIKTLNPPPPAFKNHIRTTVIKIINK